MKDCRAKKKRDKKKKGAAYEILSRKVAMDLETTIKGGVL